MAQRLAGDPEYQRYGPAPPTGLADYLLAEVFRPSASEPGEARGLRLAERAGAGETATKGRDFAALSEEEAEALLLAQLEQLNF